MPIFWEMWPFIFAYVFILGNMFPESNGFDAVPGDEQFRLPSFTN